MYYSLFIPYHSSATLHLLWVFCVLLVCFESVTTNPHPRIYWLIFGSERSLKISSLQVHVSCNATMVCLMVTLYLFSLIVCFIYPLQYACVLLQHIHQMVCIKNMEEHHNPYFFQHCALFQIDSVLREMTGPVMRYSLCLKHLLPAVHASLVFNVLPPVSCLLLLKKQNAQS